MRNICTFFLITQFISSLEKIGPGSHSLSFFLFEYKIALKLNNLSAETLELTVSNSVSLKQKQVIVVGIEKPSYTTDES